MSQQAEASGGGNPNSVDRRTFIGGSDIAGIIGLSPWHTQLDIYRRKTGAPADPDKPSRRKLLSRGHRWESVVGEMLVERLESDGHKVEVVGTNRRYVDEEHAMFACEVDYELRLDGEEEITSCELKTVHPFRSSEWGETEDDTPVWYTAQCHWGMGITGRKQTLLAPLFGADELRVYPVERDEGVISWLRKCGLNFWTEHVLTGIPPEPTTLGDVNRLHPHDNGERFTADAEMTEKWLRLRAIKNEIKARESEAEALEFSIKCAMGDHQEMYSAAYDQPVVTWKDRPQSCLDQGRLKAEHPTLHREFMKRGNSRVFTVKNIKS